MYISISALDCLISRLKGNNELISLKYKNTFPSHKGGSLARICKVKLITISSSLSVSSHGGIEMKNGAQTAVMELLSHDSEFNCSYIDAKIFKSVALL